MKKIKQREIHLRRYLILIVIFFTLELVLQGVVLINGWNIFVEGFIIPTIVNYEALFVSFAMIFMGVYYLKK